MTMSVCGYHQAYLDVELTARSARRVELPEDRLRQFLGGTGLGTWLLLQSGGAELASTDPRSPLVFAFSPLVGSPLTTSARFAVVCKSPLTERLNDSLCGSRFALNGKASGFDALVLRGRCSALSILIVDDGRVAIEDAGDLAGATTSQTEQSLRKRYGESFAAAVIGPAGENGVRFATVSHDGRHAGRGGAGAVLGSKNVKAILVRGQRRASCADRAAVGDLARRWARESLGPATAKYRELGTTANLELFERLNGLPTDNFQSGHSGYAELLSPERMQQSRRHVRRSCAACTIGCEHLYSLKPDGGAASSPEVRLEYETLFALGPLCGIRDPDLVLQAARACDEWGLDSISCGGTIAFARECRQRGLIDDDGLRDDGLRDDGLRDDCLRDGHTDPAGLDKSKRDSDRLEHDRLDAALLDRDPGAGLVELIEQIARRDGFGDRLAEGSRRLAAWIGGGAESFAPHVKGLELPGYDPRAFQSMALGFAVGTRGADHNRSSAYELDFSPEVDRLRIDDGRVAAIVDREDVATLLDSLILCKFVRGIFDDVTEAAAEALRSVTGWHVTPEELKQTARRITHAKKWFNIRSGWTASEDWLPERFFQPARGPGSGTPIDAAALRSAISAYYRAREWTDEGLISDRVLQRYGLGPSIGGSPPAAQTITVISESQGFQRWPIHSS